MGHKVANRHSARLLRRHHDFLRRHFFIVHDLLGLLPRVEVLPDPAGVATVDVRAAVRNVVGRYGSTFIPYCFRVGDREFTALFETYYDEFHRALSAGPATWYDALSIGSRFTIRADVADPRRHRVITPRWAQIDTMARYVWAGDTGEEPLEVAKAIARAARGKTRHAAQRQAIRRLLGMETPL